MRHFTLAILILLAGCSPKIEPPKEKPIQTHPAPRYKPRRMVANEKTIVAVIDTGLTIPKDVTPNLCKTGHKNFTSNRESVQVFGIIDSIPADNHGHGTNIAGLIQQYAGDANYCMVILKYYDPKISFDDVQKNTTKAIEYAISIKANYINYSAGGIVPDKDEKKILKKFLDQGGKIVVAAGNERSDIDQKDSHFYPAMDDARIIVVGNAVPITEQEIENLKEDEETKMKKTVYVEGKLAYPAISSNYGYRVNVWEYGTRKVGLYGMPMTGTSQATAIYTGKLLKNQK